MNNCLQEKKRTLMILTSACAILSVVSLVASIASDHWTNCQEEYKGKIEELSFLPKNFTGKVYVTTNFGLWRACSQHTDVKDQLLSFSLSCVGRNDWKGKEEGEQSANEVDTILNSILVKVKYMTVFPLASMALEVLGDILCVLGYYFGRRKILIFVTGILFVLSGLGLLVTLILFMGTVTGEQSHQKPVAKDEIKIFRYSYGTSLYLLVISFCLDEFAGVLSVYLFIIRHKQGFKDRHAKLTALKTKSDHLNNFLQRKRQRSVSSNEAGSRRPSHVNYAPFPEQEMSSYTLNREMSRQTVMTSLESRSNLKQDAPPSTRTASTQNTKYETIPMQPTSQENTEQADTLPPTYATVQTENGKSTSV